MAMEHSKCFMTMIVCCIYRFIAMTTGSFSREQGKLRRYISQIVKGLDFLFQAIMYCSKKNCYWKRKFFESLVKVSRATI